MLDNRRLATTKEGEVAVVPSQAWAGDKIAYFAGSGVAMLIRECLDAKNPVFEGTVIDEFEERDDDPDFKGDSYVSYFRGLLREPQALLQLPIRHCSLVGEAYISGVVGWARGKEHEKFIFAIH